LPRIFYLAAKKLSAPIRFLFQQQTLWLSAARCIFWEDESILIVSDLHFGKAGHFRKSGIGIPQNIFKDDLQRLFSQVQFFKPKILLITGDMFHSSENKEINFFLKWRKDIPAVKVYLIKGNHDILEDEFYTHSGITFFEKHLIVKNFCFTHDIDSFDNNEKNIFTFSGHIHPGVRMNGGAGQSLMLPCFYFSKEYAVLPAFSAFTGLAKVNPKKSDHVFVLAGKEILKIQ
jgi:DNA ligase-associated metallophosphoesterase